MYIILDISIKETPLKINNNNRKEDELGIQDNLLSIDKQRLRIDSVV